jgi:large subunit ribosomal protein L25
MTDVEVSCLPSALPEYIEVNLSTLDVGETLHLSDLVLPAGVNIVVLAQGAEHNLPVVSMMASKATKDDTVA